MADNSIRKQCVAALALQRERSAAYQQWTSLFHRALLGDITPSELQRNIQGIVLPEFQRISTGLRSLQTSLHEQPGSDAASKGLARWIDQLQDLEREHYGVTLSLANQLADHCTPNVLTASRSSADGAKGDHPQDQPHGAGSDGSAPPPQLYTDRVVAEPSREVVPADIKSLFKPDDSDDDPSNGEVEWRERQTRGPTTSVAPALPKAADKDSSAEVEEAQATLRVHDAARCALHRLIPPRYHTHLFFVDCREGVDALQGDNDAAAASGSSKANQIIDEEEEEEESLLPVYAKGHGAESGGTHSRPLALYSPSAVATRCVAWSRSVGPVVHRQDALRAAIEDLCEELQGEISDM